MDRKEWLKSLKEADEVCFTNQYNFARMLLGSMFDTNFLGEGSKEGKKEENSASLVCKILKVRAVLPDGCLVVGNNVFTVEGKLESGKNSVLSDLMMSGELVEPTDELRELEQRLIFVDFFKKIDWDTVGFKYVEEVAGVLLKAIKEEKREDK